MAGWIDRWTVCDEDKRGANAGKGTVPEVKIDRERGRKKEGGEEKRDGEQKCWLRK